LCWWSKNHNDVNTCRSEIAADEQLSALWNVPGTERRWSIGRRWNDTTTIMDDDDDDACTVLVDELNFWSEFTDETSVSELGNCLIVM